MSLAPEDVAVYRSPSPARYPEAPPYHPSEAYPEYPFGTALSQSPNAAFRAVRETLALLGLDRENFGTPRWNPLGSVIRPTTSW